MRTRSTAIMLAILGFSLMSASAASLGGVANSADLGAETKAVAGCDTDGVTVDFTTNYNATTAEFDLATVEIGDLDGCDTRSIGVEAYGSTGVSLGTNTGTVAGNVDATYSAAIVTRAEDVHGVAVVVNG